MPSKNYRRDSLIRFVDMSEALELEDRQAFAWFDTVTDTFLSFDTVEVWYDWSDFVADWEEEPGRPLERFKALFPKGWMYARGV